jgi:hypothetical protein
MGRPRKIKAEPEPVTVNASPEPVPELLPTQQLADWWKNREYHGKRPPLLRVLVKWGSATD